LEISGKKTVTVSLLAANFNNGPYLREFIQSILSSTLLPEQLIIVDDCSTDDSRQILKEYETLPIACFIYSEKNEGFANALNKGIDAVTAKYVLRADPDDLLQPLRIEKQFGLLENNPHLCGVGCNVAYFQSETGKILNKSNFPESTEDISKLYLLGEHGLQHPTVMMKSEVLKQFSYRQSQVPAEDYDLFARLIEQGYQFRNIKEVLYKMRIHPSSISSNLQFETIQKTYALRKEIFGKKTTKVKEKLYFYHILNYRKYLLEQNLTRKYCFLLLSTICHPLKLLNRIIPF
jgi:glycosyltransferase involved in cell wall biosynthesis